MFVVNDDMITQVMFVMNDSTITLSDQPLLEPWMSSTVRLVDDHIFIALGFMPYRP
jgi:hypothetical protein